MRLLVLFVLLVVGRGCLQPPSSVTHDPDPRYGDESWEEIDSTTFHTTLVYDVIEVAQDANGSPTTFRARGFNGRIPLPTLRMYRGFQYQVTVQNNLGPESPDNPLGGNVFKDANTTNIHTHGLHISGEEPGDDVHFSIPPGGSHTYIYNVPCHHAGGTFWYHPHHHGSTMLQVASGAVGAIIIEDNPTIEGLPQYVQDMPEYVMVVQKMDLDLLESFPDDIDFVSEVSDDGPRQFHLVNGVFTPTICLDAGEWTRLRIVHADPVNALTLTIGGAGCSMQLLAKDGVLVHGTDNTTPRPVTSMFFTVASRADVLLQCSGPATYTLLAGAVTIATFDVQANTAGGLASSVTEFNPVRPRYLESLLSYDGSFFTYTNQPPRGGGTPTNDPFWNINLGGRTINGQSFVNGDTYLVDNIPTRSVHEWRITGANGHPFHAHLHHMQIFQGGLTGGAGWTEQGDWLDVIGADATVRLEIGRWGGGLTMHCHILQHEDEGLMGVIHITDGCDALLQPYNGGPCDSSCSAPWDTAAVVSVQNFFTFISLPTLLVPSAQITVTFRPRDSIRLDGQFQICFESTTGTVSCRERPHDRQHSGISTVSSIRVRVPRASRIGSATSLSIRILAADDAGGYDDLSLSSVSSPIDVDVPAAEHVLPGLEGDPIYTTFDHLTFEYTGICPVLLTKDCADNKFSVVGYNTPCGLKSCVEQVVLECEDERQKVSSVTLSLGPEVMLNKEEVDVKELYLTEKTLRVGGLSVRAALSDTPRAGSSVVVNASCAAGVSISFTGAHWGVASISVSPSSSPVCGLLGNNDGSPLNDVTYQNGNSVGLSDRDLTDGVFANTTVINDWVWDWTTNKHERTKEECMAVSDEFLITKQCLADDFRRESVERLCSRMLAALPTSRDCGSLHMEALVSKCAHLTCSCFNMPQKLLTCVQWSVRELQNSCKTTPAHNTNGVGFLS